jgi:hypothetical protein
VNVVYVYLGQVLPKYAVASIHRFNIRFPKQNMTFISDIETNLEVVGNLGIRTHLVTNPVEAWPELREHRSVDPNFRDGFWLLTLARFQAIAQFMAAHPNESVLQVECDVLLFPNFPFELINSSAKEISYPLVNDNEAAPSLVYFKSEKAVSNLLDFASRQISLRSKLTDMTILHAYWLDYPDHVQILPTNIDQEVGFQPWVTNHLRTSLSEGFDIYNGIFDAATWGQYIGGEDPRNTLGIRRVFHVLKHHAVDPSQFDWFYQPKTESPYVLVGSRKAPIFCLHIHSKDLKFFSKNSGSRLQKRIDSLPCGEKREFILQIALTNFRMTTLKIIFTVQLKRLKKFFGTSQ